MIRLATRSDAASFAEVIVAAQSTWLSWAGDAFQPYDTVDLVRTWEARLSRDSTVALCDEQDGTLVAVASAGLESDSFEPSHVSDTAAHLSTLFARPEVHGSRVSQCLHDALLVELASRKFSTVRLWVPTGAARARRFYLRNGWLETGAVTNFAGLERIGMRRQVTS